MSTQRIWAILATPIDHLNLKLTRLFLQYPAGLKFVEEETNEDFCASAYFC